MARRDLTLAALHGAWLAGLLPTHQRFARTLREGTNPVRTDHRLRRLLTLNRDTVFGKMFRFSSISNFETFRRAVPIHDYDDLVPHLERARRGEPRILTAEPIRFFERSGGTSREHTKLIPYTDSMLRELQAATNPWLADLYLRHPGLIGRPAYWSLSPAAQGPRKTEGQIPIGIDDDTGFFDPVRRLVLARSMAVPATLVHAPDIDSWRRETLAHLLACRSLGFVSVWSPTFLTALLDHLRNAPPLDHPALRPHRRHIEAALAGPREGLGSRLWPDLAVISCWADGPSAIPARTLASVFPAATLEPKGLLATEGVVTIPWGKDRAPTLAASHLLEFIPLDHSRGANPPTVLPHELEVGRDYSPVLTTGAGLYRYHLKDVVRCTGPHQLRFVGKLDLVGDLVGEKLDGLQVTRLVETLAHELELTLGSWLVTPDPSRTGYGLFTEHPHPELANRLEAALCQGHAYRYARDLGQLGPITPHVLPGLGRHMLEEATRQGQRLGDIKPQLFDPRPRWHNLFRQADDATVPHVPKDGIRP